MTATGYVTYSPVEELRHQGDEFKTAASGNSWNGPHAFPCITLGGAADTGHTHYYVPPSGYCPCYYEPIYRRAFTACNAYEALSVDLCMDGEIKYAANYAACSVSCSSSLYLGYHHCGTPGTGSAGWSIDTVACSDSYLADRSPPSRGTVIRYEAKLCFVKFTICDTVAFHVNTYPSGSITGPYDGVGSYE